MRVISRREPVRVGLRAATSTACSKWRRFAFTEPNTTSFSSTSSLLSAPTSTLRLRDGATPVRQTIAPGRGVPHRAGHQLRDAGALDDHVGLALLRHLGDVAVCDSSAPSAATASGLTPSVGAVEHVHLEAALDSHQRRQQADRAGAGHEHALVGASRRACAMPLDLLPGLGEDARRLGEHAERAELVGDRDREVLLDRHELGAVAVERLDAALRVLAVAAHVPLAPRAARARHRVGAPDDAGDQLAGSSRCPRALARARAARGRARAARGRAAARRGRPRGSPGRCRTRRGRAARRAARRRSGSGSGSSVSSALPGWPGITVIARMTSPLPADWLGQRSSVLLRRRVQLSKSP